jgi:hypothetical protein
VINSGINRRNGPGAIAAKRAIILGSNSRVRNVWVQFSEPVICEVDAITLALHTNGVEYAGVDRPNGYGTIPGSYSITNMSLPNQFDPDNYDPYVANFTVFGLTDFFGPGTVDFGFDFRSLLDGVYQVRVNGNKVYAKNRLNPDLSLIPGTSFVGVCYRLFGDTTGLVRTPVGLGATYETTINPADEFAFLNNFNRTGPPLSISQYNSGLPTPGYIRDIDIDGDGIVNPGDYLEFLSRFNETLRWSA